MRRITACLLALVAALSACGDDDESDVTVEEFENEGSLCIRSIEAGGGDAIHVVASFPTCLSSSCSRRLDTSCEVIRNGDSLRIESSGSVEHRGGTCTADCGSLAAECDSPALPAGDYTVVYGERTATLTLPTDGTGLFGAGPAGVFCIAPNDAGAGGSGSGGQSGAGRGGTGGGDAGPDDECFSPTQNLDRAYEAGAVGCPCLPRDGDRCVDGVALVCSNERWAAVEDGPCEPRASCENGEIVDSAAGCLQDDAFCYALEDGRYCTGPTTPMCPEGTTPTAPDAECPASAQCFQYSESLRCSRPLATADPCAPHDAHYTGTCEPADRFYWTGVGCVGRTGCSCSGNDCERGFATSEDCEAEFEGCFDMTIGCGGWRGNACGADEYCAYVPELLCGAADASSICQVRPTACDDILDPVCGCDGMTYPNACEANAAGSGIREYASCE